MVVIRAIYVPDLGFVRHNRQLAIFVSTDPHKTATRAGTGCTNAVPLRLLLAQTLFSSAIAKDLVDVCGVGGQLAQGNACCEGFFFDGRVG